MAINIHNLIAAIAPEVFCQPTIETGDEQINLIAQVKEVRAKEGYKAASEKAKPRDVAFVDLIDITDINAVDAKGLKAPIEKHALVYDSFGESLEPVYFWILDKMNEEYKVVDKLVDNFVSSPGSGHFSEMGAKATKMQEEGMKMLGAANQVVKSILNIIYDLKEFQLRLSIYDEYKNTDAAKKNSALLSLKQIWMDTVDTKRGNSAILMLARNFDYVTIIDAFMAADSLERVTKSEDKGGIDLNDRVRRLLQQRVGEFFRWVEESEKELRKRFEIEKIYLRSQVNTVKLYARWAKPYLRAAQKLEQNATSTAAVVTNFNTSVFELILLGVSDYKPEDDVARGELPTLFKNATKKKYSPVLVVEFKYRSSPERTQQGYGFRGRVEVAFTSYALTSEELKVLREEIEKDDLGDIIKLVEGATDESLKQINLDIKDFLGDDKKEEKKADKKNAADTNPFSALFSLFKRDTKEEKKDGSPTSDKGSEKVIRSQALIEARKKCYRVYDLYKKSHAMPSLPGYA